MFAQNASADLDTQLIFLVVIICFILKSAFKTGLYFKNILLFCSFIILLQNAILIKSYYKTLEHIYNQNNKADELLTWFHRCCLLNFTLYENRSRWVLAFYRRKKKEESCFLEIPSHKFPFPYVFARPATEIVNTFMFVFFNFHFFRRINGGWNTVMYIHLTFCFVWQLLFIKTEDDRWNERTLKTDIAIMGQ